MAHPMPRNTLRAASWTLVAVAIIGGLVWFGWPRPIPADVASVDAADMVVTVDEEAKTRVRHVYTVSAPVMGKVLRTSRHIGDEVIADETVVAVIEPIRPALHDLRTHEELRAALAAADAAVLLAEADIRRLHASLSFARSEFNRALQLAKTDAISLKALDKAMLEVEVGEAALASAKAQLEVRRSERASAAARLIDPISLEGQSAGTCCIQIRSPVSGRVLRIPQESEAVVQPGTPIIEIGNPQDLEVVVDLLSQDATRVRSGASVRIENWGGSPLRGRIVNVYPAGFMKVSALGIEEQRVKAVIDFVDPPGAWSALGHDYRVMTYIEIWRGSNVLTIPVGALFRKGSDWAVFVVKDGRASIQPIRIGNRSSNLAEVLGGLAKGDQIILHPSDRIKEGVRIVARNGE
jgi:HlyD family secretion protein